ncbi:MAG: septal ring lytic transglycosylase RlpA family protein [Bacteroidia bacterium]|nr:septal ring lytic transglycosylase RlpA family protein [Bacteroidia bacterium]
MKCITMQKKVYRISLFLLVNAVILPLSSFSQPKPVECKASFYADFFHGRKTANGEIFNQKQLTAAHRSLPFGTLLKVTNTENKQSVVVRVNDRGPYVKGRGIDLSRAAASQIGIIRKGVANVVIEPLNNDEAYSEYAADYYQNDENQLYTYEDDLNALKRTESNYDSDFGSQTVTAQQETVYESQGVVTSPNYTEILVQNMKYTPEGLFTVGNAIVFPDAYEGRVMKNGELYNGGQYICAHNKYSIGSYLKVTRKSNPDLSVIVQVTDNQSTIPDYDIQLSWAAASDLDIFEAFDRSVIVEEIKITDLDALPAPDFSSANPTTNPERSIEIDFFDGSASLRGESALPVPAVSGEAGNLNEGATAESGETVLKTGGLGLFKLEASRMPENGYGIQIAVVSQYREVLEISDNLYRHGIQNTMIHSDVVGNKEVLRYIVGPFTAKEEAEKLKNKLESENIYGMIIRLEPLR